MIQFNGDCAARDKLGAGKYQWHPLQLKKVCFSLYLLFPKHVCVKDSNEAEVLAILKALHLYNSTFQENLIMEITFLNDVSWSFFFNKINSLASSIQVVVCHVGRSKNSMPMFQPSKGLTDNKCWLRLQFVVELGIVLLYLCLVGGVFLVLAVWLHCVLTFLNQ